MTNSAQKLTVACIQNCATPEITENLSATLALSRDAAARGAQLICLPEYFSGLETDAGRIIPVAYPEENHPALAAFTGAARDHGVWFLLGSLGISAPDGRTFNRSYLIAPDGRIAARYDKIHMFDVNLEEGIAIRESATIAPGSMACVAPTPWGGLGLSICYDLRFAGLYRALAHAGARMLAVPAAFTKMTGEAHWHVLNRARAIETGSFVIAPCQHGTLAGGAECFGHSLIISPWGEILADGGDGDGCIVAGIDLTQVDAARARIPALQHDRDFSMSADVESPGHTQAAE